MKRTIIAAAVAAAAALSLAPSAQADPYADMFATVDFLAHKYGVHAEVGQALLPNKNYGETRGTTIVFNSNYIADPDWLRSSITNDINNGYHVGALCTPEQALATHEFAHVLDNLRGREARVQLVNAVNNGFDGIVSGYSLVSPGEALAEAFTAVECDTPNETEQAIYNMLMD